MYTGNLYPWKELYIVYVYSWRPLSEMLKYYIIKKHMLHIHECIQLRMHSELMYKNNNVSNYF